MTPEERGKAMAAGKGEQIVRFCADLAEDVIADLIREAIEADRVARQCPDADVAAIRERCAKATPGPWHHSRYFRWGYVTTEEGGGGVLIADALEPGDRLENCDQHLDNADFIAHAREDIPKLLDDGEFLRKLIHDLQQDSDAYQRGLEDGRREERERAVRWARHHETSMWRFAGSCRQANDEQGALVCRGGATTACQIANDIEQQKGDPS